jgi:hypothetical protein
MILQELNVKVGLLLDEFQKNSEKLKKEANSIENVFTQMKGALAAAGIFSFIKSSIADFIEAERSSIQLGYRLKGLGSNYSEAKKEVENFVDVLSRQTKLEDDDLRNATTNLIDLTKDRTTAMRLMADVTDLMVGKDMDAKQASELVGRAYNGEQRALQELGRMFGVSRGNATDFVTVMTAMRSQIGDVSKDTEGLGRKLGGISVAFGNMKEEIGKLASGGGIWSGIVTSLLETVTKGLKIINEFQGSMRASWANIGSIFKKGWKATHEDAKKIYDDFIANTVEIMRSGEEEKTKIEKVQSGKRQKWMDDKAKANNKERQKEESDFIRQEDQALRNRIAKGQATNQELIAQMKLHAMEMKNIFGEESVEYQEYEKSRIEATMAANDYIMQSGQAVVGALSSGFEAMFMAIAKDGADAAKAMEAFSRAIGRSFLNSIAAAVEAEAAKGMAGYLSNMLIGGPAGAGVVSAYSLPMIAALAATAGTVRGLAAMMADGGTLTRPGLVMMAEKQSGEPETAIPLSRMDDVFQKYQHFIGKKGLSTSGSTVVIQRVIDNRGAIVATSDFDKGKAAKQVGDLLTRYGVIKKGGR